MSAGSIAASHLPRTYPNEKLMHGHFNVIEGQAGGGHGQMASGSRPPWLRSRYSIA